MKRTLLCTVILLFGLLIINAQEIKYGVKSGLDFSSLKVKNQTYIVLQIPETGFYVGGFAENGAFLMLLLFRPELLYVAVDGLNQISIPLMAKYEVSEDFNVLAGPSLGLFT